MGTTEQAGQRPIQSTLVYAVYRYSLEPHERISIDYAQRIMVKYRRKKHAECLLHFFEDRMVFQKAKSQENSPFRTWVGYKELLGFRRDLKYKTMFVMLINSEVSHARYYEVYRCKNKEDIHMVEQCVRRAMEDPEGLLRSEDQSGPVQAALRTTSASPVQKERFGISDKEDTIGLTPNNLRSKSTSPIIALMDDTVKEGSSLVTPVTRKVMNATPGLHSPAGIRKQTCDRSISPVSTMPMARLSFSDQLSSINETVEPRPQRVTLVSSTPPGIPSSFPVYQNGYPNGPDKTRTIPVGSKTGGAQSTDLPYLQKYHSDFAEQQVVLPIMSPSEPNETKLTSVTYSGGYPVSKNSVPTSGPVRYISVPYEPALLSLDARPDSRDSDDIHLIRNEQPVYLESQPVRFSGSHSDRVDEKPIWSQATIPIYYENENPEKVYSQVSSNNMLRPQPFEPTQLVEASPKPVREVGPTFIHPEVYLNNVDEPKNYKQAPSKLEQIKLPTPVNGTIDSGYGDASCWSNDVADDIVTAIPISLRSSPDNLPDRFSVHRIDSPRGGLSQTAKLLCVSMPALNSIPWNSPAEFNRKNLGSLSDVTYVNNNDITDFFSNKSGPVYLYAARQPSVGNMRSSSP